MSKSLYLSVIHYSAYNLSVIYLRANILVLYIIVLLYLSVNILRAYYLSPIYIIYILS